MLSGGACPTLSGANSDELRRVPFNLSPRSPSVTRVGACHDHTSYGDIREPPNRDPRERLDVILS